MMIVNDDGMEITGSTWVGFGGTGDGGVWINGKLVSGSDSTVVAAHDANLNVSQDMIANGVVNVLPQQNYISPVLVEDALEELEASSSVAHSYLARAYEAARKGDMRQADASLWTFLRHLNSTPHLSTGSVGTLHKVLLRQAGSNV